MGGLYSIDLWGGGVIISEIQPGYYLNLDLVSIGKVQPH